MGNLASGPPPDPDRIRTNTPAIGEVQVPDQADVPAPPAGLDAIRTSEWLTFWHSDVAGAVTRAHLPALERLFSLRQESADAHRDCKDTPLVEGSQEQMVANPRCKQAIELDKEIRQLEDRFGMTPLSMLRLGIKTGQAALARRTARQVVEAERADQERAEQEAAERYADPRLANARPTPPE